MVSFEEAEGKFNRKTRLLLLKGVLEGLHLFWGETPAIQPPKNSGVTCLLKIELVREVMMSYFGYRGMEYLKYLAVQDSRSLLELFLEPASAVARLQLRVTRKPFCLGTENMCPGAPVHVLTHAQTRHVVKNS